MNGSRKLVRYFWIAALITMSLIVGKIYQEKIIFSETKNHFERSKQQVIFIDNIRDLTLESNRLKQMQTKRDQNTQITINQKLKIENYNKKIGRLRNNIYHQLKDDFKKLFHKKIMNRDYLKEAITNDDINYLELVSQFTGIEIREHVNNVETILESSSRLLTYLNTFFIFFILATYLITFYKIKKIVISRDSAFSQLQDETAYKNTLLQVMGHDINNALQVISLSAGAGRKILRNETPKIDRALDLLADIVRSADIIASIGQNVRTLQAAAMGITKIELGPVDLESIFEQTKFVFTGKLQDKGLQLNLPDDNGIKILAENISFANNVFNNIISNAIKFSPEGSKIDVSIKEEETNILISIRDYGIGIPQDILGKIFNPNKAVSRKGTKNEAGTGLGLAIVKTFMESYQGEIDIISNTPEHNPHAESGTTCILKLKNAT